MKNTNSMGFDAIGSMGERPWKTPEGRSPLEEALREVRIQGVARLREVLCSPSQMAIGDALYVFSELPWGARDELVGDVLPHLNWVRGYDAWHLLEGLLGRPQSIDITDLSKVLYLLAVEEDFLRLKAIEFISYFTVDEIGRAIQSLSPDIRVTHQQAFDLACRGHRSQNELIALADKNPMIPNYFWVVFMMKETSAELADRIAGSTQKEHMYFEAKKSISARRKQVQRGAASRSIQYRKR